MEVRTEINERKESYRINEAKWVLWDQCLPSATYGSGTVQSLGIQQKTTHKNPRYNPSFGPFQRCSFYPECFPQIIYLSHFPTWFFSKEFTTFWHTFFCLSFFFVFLFSLFLPVFLFVLTLCLFLYFSFFFLPFVFLLSFFISLSLFPAFSLPFFLSFSFPLLSFSPVFLSVFLSIYPLPPNVNFCLVSSLPYHQHLKQGLECGSVP